MCFFLGFFVLFSYFTLMSLLALDHNVCHLLFVKRGWEVKCVSWN